MTPERKVEQQIWAALSADEQERCKALLLAKITGKIERNILIYEEYLTTTKPLRALGEPHGISVERTRQVICKLQRFLRLRSQPLRDLRADK